MIRRVCYFLFIIFGFIAYSSQGENLTMDYSDISVSLEINHSVFSTFVTVTFTNNSDQNDCKIPKWFLAENGLEDNLFEIVDSENNQIEYIGKFVKRGRIRESDLISIQPKESISARIRLNKYYKLPLITNNLKIRFFVLYEIESIMQPFFCKFLLKQVDRQTPASNVFRSAIDRFARSTWKRRGEASCLHSGIPRLPLSAC